jgi:hypothetical protein
MFAEQRADQVLVAHIAFDETHPRYGLPEASGEIVEHHHGLAARQQLLYRVAADVAGSACHQDRFTHRFVAPLARNCNHTIMPA